MITYRNLMIEEALKFWNMMKALDYETKYMMYEPGERQENEKNLQQLKALIGSAAIREQFLLAAVCGDEIVGYLLAQRGSLNRIAHTAYIVVGIRETFRGQGIGKEFFRQLDIWAIEKGITRLELTVMCKNKVAKHLYEKNGFVVEGVKKNSMKVDHEYVDEYYMAKLL